MSGSGKPLVFSYCATFLPAEMWHVYRQISGISAFDSWVVTRRRSNAGMFPWEKVLKLPKSPFRFINRLRYRLTGGPVRLSGYEVRHFRKLIQARQPAVLHAYLGSEALRILEVLREFPGGRIVSFHGGDLSSRFDAEAYRELWPLVDLVLCRSESLRTELLRRNCPAERIRLNRTGVPVPEQGGRGRLPDRRKNERLEILQVCRLIRKKGLDVTVEAVKRLIDRGISVRLTIAGEGSEAAALRARVHALGIADQVVFPGFVAGVDLEALYDRSHIFVHPSRTTEGGDREGIPNSLLEAMAHGLPVVATRHSGIPEVIRDGETGRLIEAADAGSLADAIGGLFDDAELFASLARRGRRAVEESFSLAANRACLEKYYREAIDLRRRAVPPGSS